MRFADVERAAIPTSAMMRLAVLRDRRGLEVALSGRHLWLRWPDGEESIAATLFAIPGCRLFEMREGRWHEPTRSLPAFDMPEALSFRPIAAVILPTAMETTPATDFAPIAMRLALVADTTYRPTLAVACSLDAFAAWAREVPPCRLRKLRAARDGARLFVLGKALPWIEGGERFWGRSVLVPIGFRPSPNFSESALRTLVGVAESDLLVIRMDGCERIAQDCFTTLSHGALRLAAREAAT
ncbi:MAG TPA: hypothetical protein VHR72_03770 [Gemmataceae bacterium]|jgi:hypothetical protein|nr:hypothetical protein [Gemmataceae bacterium]